MEKIGNKFQITWKAKWTALQEAAEKTRVLWSHQDWRISTSWYLQIHEEKQMKIKERQNSYGFKSKCQIVIQGLKSIWQYDLSTSAEDNNCTKANSRQNNDIIDFTIMKFIQCWKWRTAISQNFVFEVFNIYHEILA